MNKNLDLIKILKDCPIGTKLYSAIHGEVEFNSITPKDAYPISVRISNGFTWFARDGRYNLGYNGECMLFPSKNQRNWNKFKSLVKKKEE